MAHDMLTFVQLAEEFGGTKFGPFDGPEIRFGSDPDRSDIRLPDSLGVLPEHVKVIKQRDQSFILAPTERSAGVFVWRQGSKPKQITSPIAIQSGDGFSLVTEQGPRFYMLVEQPPDQVREKAKKGLDAAKGRVSKAGFFAEVKRRGLASVLATGVGHAFQNVYTFIATGAILQPRYIITGVLLVGGWIVAGGAGCAVLKLNWDLGSAQTTIEEREGDLAECQTLDQEEPTLANLTAQILGDSEWTMTLNTDGELRTAYVKKLKAMQRRSARANYEWVYKNKSGPFVSFRNRLVREEYPDALINVVAYAAAVSRQDRDRGTWNSVLEDSSGAPMCVRGPVQLTYRQGLNLELEELRVDALVPGTVAASNDVEPKRAALTQTALDAGQQDVEFSNDEVADAKADIQGGNQCIYVDGEDDRESVNKLVAALTKSVGPSADRLPAVSDDFWVAARVIKLYAADFQQGYPELDFTEGVAPSVVLDAATDAQKRYAVDQAAELMARSVAISCWAALDRELGEPPEHLGTLPSKISCYLLNYVVDEEG